MIGVGVAYIVGVVIAFSAGVIVGGFSLAWARASLFFLSQFKTKESSRSLSVDFLEWDLMKPRSPVSESKWMKETVRGCDIYKYE